MTSYGTKGGAGPTGGKTARVYEVTIPEQFGGGTVLKRKFGVDQPTLPATGFMDRRGKPVIVVWDNPALAWAGKFGPLVARRVK